MTYDILATGSSGNAVVINGEILIDCGIPMKKLRESGCIKNLKLVLLTHQHSDHFTAATVRALHLERPALRWGCCEWMLPPLLEAGVDKRSIFLFDCDDCTGYHFKCADIFPFPLVHDLPNCGYKLIIGGKSLFYATDTGSLDHVRANSYDYYLIEANHTRAEIEARIADKLARGEFAYEARAMLNHLSQEQALDWLARNAGMNSEYVFLHQHKGGDRNG